MSISLILPNLAVNVYLGWESIERSTAQLLSVYLELQFEQLLPACYNDELIGTICYDQLSTQIVNFALSRPFRLLEAFGYQLSQFIKTQLREKTITNSMTLILKITKKSPNPSLENFIVVLKT